MRNGDVYRFGSYELDSGSRLLYRGQEPIALSRRHMTVLLQLVANAGRVVPKKTLTDAAWDEEFVGDNSVEQVLSDLRKVLGLQPDGTPHIETLNRRGYRFRAPVQRGRARESKEALDARLLPYLSFVDGRVALESLTIDAIPRALQVFGDLLPVMPDHPAPHLGMGNASFLAFESTRADVAPDLAALQRAHHHAFEACQIDPESGDAWSTRAIVLGRLGDGRGAYAAARRAVDIEPDNWLHWLRLATVSWGEESIRAAQRASSLCPGLAFAEFFPARVYIARQAFDPAIKHLRAGCAAQDAQRKEKGRFGGVGLHWLLALVLGARGAHDEAFEELDRELAFEECGHVYARECAANSWYAIGALHHRLGRPEKAEPAFQEALKRVPGHGLATVGLSIVSGKVHRHAGRDDATLVDAAMVKAAALAVQGKQDAAARVFCGPLTQAEPGAAGWLLPAEPLIHATAHLDAWAPTLAILRDRAR